MSDHVAQSYHDGDESAGQVMHSYQSVWMSHWMRTSHNTAPRVDNCLPPHLENKENYYDVKGEHCPSRLEMASDISTSAKRFRQLTEARTVKTMNESLTTGSKNLINERSDCQPFAMFNIGQSSRSTSIPKNDQDTSCNMPSVTKFNNIALGTGTSQVEVGPSATKATSPHEFSGSTTHTVPFRFDKGRNTTSSLVCRQVENNELTSGLACKDEQERCNYRSHSTFLFCEKTMDNNSNGENSKTLFNSRVSLHDPSPRNYHLPLFVGEQYQKIQNCSKIGFFPNHNSRQEATNPEKLYHGCYSVNSVNGMPGGPPKYSQRKHGLITETELFKESRFSQTKHNRLISESEVNLSRENRMLRESRASTKFSEPVLKFKPPVSSSTSDGGEEKKIAKHVDSSEVHLKNESSVETDTMDMDVFKERHISGDHPSPSNKDIQMGPDPLSQATNASNGREVGCKQPFIMLPDINEELPAAASSMDTALPAAASSMDNEEPTSSKTQSLDVEHLLSHAEQLSNSKVIPLTCSPLGPEPSSRWVKRLKPIVSDSFALGTKSSNLGEGSNHEKAKRFSRIMKGNIGSSEMISGKCHGKEPMALDQTATLSRDTESSSMDKAKAGRDILLSHFWIQRWCHNRAATIQKNPKAVAVCEPQSSKVPFDEFQKKQFPSVAAMALMGKAMSGFRSCEFQKRGSIMVWNVKGR